MDLRMTPPDRDLLDRPVKLSGTDLSDFVVIHAYADAQEVLAVRDRFDLESAPSRVQGINLMARALLAVAAENEPLLVVNDDDQ